MIAYLAVLTGITLLYVFGPDLRAHVLHEQRRRHQKRMHAFVTKHRGRRA